MVSLSLLVFGILGVTVTVGSAQVPEAFEDFSLEYRPVPSTFELDLIKFCQIYREECQTFKEHADELHVIEAESQLHELDTSDDQYFAMEMESDEVLQSSPTGRHAFLCSKNPGLLRCRRWREGRSKPHLEEEENQLEESDLTRSKLSPEALKIYCSLFPERKICKKR